MKSKNIGYILLVIIAFVVGSQSNINFKTSQVVTSDVIAVVNNDQKQIYLDEYVKFGDNFVDQLLAMDTKYKYNLTSSAESSQGLVSGKYAAEISIPSNFTQSILSINSEAPTKSQLSYRLSEKLSLEKSNEVESEIKNIFLQFQDNLTYMFIYSIFDSLHTSQEGIGVVAENSQPVYQFIEDILAINIVTNHEYQLEENNTETFTQIDISKQLEQFNNTVKTYKDNVANVLTLYKEENDGFSTLVDLSLTEMEENDDLLNDRIKNVEDTLAQIVENNQQYTADEYSLTATKDDMQAIISKYLRQLLTVNDAYDLNKLLVGDAATFGTELQSLNGNQQYRSLRQLIEARIGYYTQLDTIATTCLTKTTETEAKACIDLNYDNYQTAYTQYQNLITEFDNEQNYEQSMTYYLQNIGSSSTAKTASTEKNTVDLPVETVEQSDKLGTMAAPTMSAVSYGESQFDQNYIGLQIDNLEDTGSLTIDIKNKDNVSNLVYIGSNQNDLDVTVENNRIRISSINNSSLTLIFNVEKVFEAFDATIDFEFEGVPTAITISGKAPLVATPTISEDQTNLTISYQYTVQEGDTQVAYSNSQLIADGLIASFEFSDDAGGKVTPTSDGFVIDTTSLAVGDKVEFTAFLPNNLGSQNYIETYTVNDKEYALPIINNYATTTASLSVSDEGYEVDGTRIKSKDEDDIDANNLIEPSEEIGIKYNFNYSSPFASQVSSLTISYDFLPELFETIIAEDVLVAVNGEVVPVSTTINENKITVSFDEQAAIDDLETPDVVYEADITVYITTTTLPEFDLSTIGTDINIQMMNPIVTVNNHLESYTNSEARKIKLALGLPSLDSVTYSVNAASCSGEVKIENCQFEAGETFSRTITITNNSPDVSAGLKLSDLITGNDGYMTETMANKFTLEADSLTADQINQYLSKIDQSIANQVVFSLPANSSLTIESEFTIDELIKQTVALEDLITLSQYQIDKNTATATINIEPLKLNVQILDSTEMVNDGLITADEAIDFTIEVKNTSTRGVSVDQGIAIKNDNPNAIKSIEVLGAEDSDWNEVSTTSVSSDIIKLNKRINPNETVTVKVRVRFNNLSSASASNITFTFESFKGTYEPGDSSTCSSRENCDQITFGLAKNTNYLELARNQASNETVMGGDTYDNSLAKTTDLKDHTTNLQKVVGDLGNYINKYYLINAKFDKFTTEDNQDLQTYIDNLKAFGLGYESEEDENYLAEYDYCQDNNELSCQLFNLYNKVYQSEEKVKKHFDNILQTIDPDSEEILGYKPSENGEKDPLNIGADFNGFGICFPIIGEGLEIDECQRAEPGINQRIKDQKDNVSSLNDNIDLILDNQVEEIDEEPYKEELAKIDQDTQATMDQVQVENNQLFDKKIDIYDENYQRVMTYLQEVSADKSYIELANQFKKEETSRQEVSAVILGNVYNLMPNTYLSGMPNKLVYSFISSPFAVNDGTEQSTLNKVSESSNKIMIYTISILGVTTLLLVLVYYLINRRT